VADAPAPPPPKPRRERPKRPPKPAPSALELVEAEVERAEARLADVEQKLADDWADVELVAAHKRARDDLQRLLERWEALFAASSG
jgi:multidrug resistance efflux pump